jgi:hypothetical protein
MAISRSLEETGGSSRDFQSAIVIIGTLASTEHHLDWVTVSAPRECGLQP